LSECECLYVSILFNIIEHFVHTRIKIIKEVFCRVLVYCAVEWKQMSERLDEATKGRITAQNEAGEAKSELVIIQVHG